MLADALAIKFQYDIDYQQMWHLVHIDGQLLCYLKLQAENLFR